MRIRAYLHSNKEDMCELGEEAGLTSDALDAFRYALYEVAFDLEVDERTGKATILTVDGRALAQEAKP